MSSHFTANDSSRKRQNFVREIHKVSYKTCASELEALVLENVEIKRLWPRYNVSLKRPEQKYALYQYEDSRGYIHLAIDKKKKNLRALYHFNLLHEGMVLLRKMIAEFDLHEKLCHLDKTAWEEKDLEFLDRPLKYNRRVKKAILALEEQLPTFAVVDEGKHSEEKLCLLLEKGSFWGMGYVPASYSFKTVEDLKNHLEPYPDNDYIRNNIYAFVEAHPEKKILLMG